MVEPVAPAPSSEANPQTSNPTAEAESQAPAPAENGQLDEKQLAAKYLGITPEELDEVQRNAAANGGLMKLHARYKQITGNPKASQMAQNNEPAPAQQPAQQPAQPTQPQMQVEGGLKAEEVLAKAYFRDLASEEAYAGISKQLMDGTALKEMDKLGVELTVNGQFNDKKIRTFLDMYVKTMPSEPASAPVTNTPTVEWANVGEAITSQDDALKVLRQSMEMEQKGQGRHPLYAEAQAFMANGYKDRHPGPRNAMTAPMQQGQQGQQSANQ